MRQLAEDALAAYELRPARLTLIAHLYNTTFRVDADGGQRYMLRIHRSGSPTVESVAAELAWLAALRRDTDLEVPPPVATRSGPLLTLAATSGVPRPHICVLFRWLPGRRVEHGLTPWHLERIGELMARLQNHAGVWAPRRSLARGRVDWAIEAASEVADPFAPEIVASIHDLVAATLSPEEAAQVRAVLERIRAAEQVLGKGPDNFGLMHADLHFRNLLFGRGTVRAIDFDDCGFGPLLFDPAVMLSELLDRPAYPALRAALLAGYRRFRPLPVEHEGYVDTFIALRRLQDVLWMLEGRQHPALRDDWAAQARAGLVPLAEFLDAHPDRPVAAWLR
ncbi:MAG TPA: phosphotransferase [Chloroflexia bacterium]|nr:phosphotransferase [Chloroflexia bacterium]